MTREPKVEGRPVWAEVRLKPLERNLRKIRAFLDASSAAKGEPKKRVKIFAVVKGNGYGHGGAQTAKAFAKAGADAFCVTCTSEGIELREAKIRQPILVLTGFWQGEEKRLIDYRLTPAITDCRQLKILERAAARAQRMLRGPLEFHLKMDTGMNRLGVPPGSAACVARTLADCPHLRLAGTFTHFSASEVLTTSDTADQARVFRREIAKLRELDVNPGIVHMANSAAIVSHPDTWADAVRPGALIYGYHQNYDPPSRTAEAQRELPLESALSFRARIIALRDVPVGEGVGYNSTFRAARPSRIAVISAGYADGIHRGMARGGSVLVRGRFAPVAGTVSMDLAAVDVTEIDDVQIGDVATIYGTDGNETQVPFDVARQNSTVTAHLLVSLGWRVPRIYYAQ
jgi:alanine racemase